MPVKTEPFNVGDEVVFYADFTNAADVATNPATLTLAVQDPAGIETSYGNAQLTNPSTGRWEKTLEMTKSGRYHYKWTATSGLKVAKTGTVLVAEDEFS